jgi:rubrerythrin
VKSCKKPCIDCPWRKTSLKGWLGDQDPQLFTDIIKSGSKLPCHKTQKKKMNLNELDNDDKILHCTGALITMKNNCLRSRNPKIAKLQNNISQDDNFFKNLNDFEKYHSNPFYSLEEFLNSEDWDNFIQDIGNDEIARKLYLKVNDKPKCKGCGSICEDIDSYYETYYSGGMFSGDGYCIYCCENS